MNAKGALAALLVGFALGLFRLAIDTPVMLEEGFAYEEGSFFWIINNTFFQYYSLFIFIVSAITMVVVSYASESPVYEQIKGLTIGTVTAGQKAETRATYTTIDYVISGLVIVLILVVYMYFTG